MKKRSLVIVVILLLLSQYTYSALSVASIFCDHMVLQQGSQIPVWGWAQPGDIITVEINKEVRTAIAKDDGSWKIFLHKLSVGGPFTMVVSASEVITISDIYVGEVWLCSGQSNMEMTVARENRYWCGVFNEEKEVKNADFPLIRFYKIPKTESEISVNEIDAEWEVCSPENIGHHSAAAYFFAKELFEYYKIPVGIINSSYGASTIEAWTKKEYLEADSLMTFLLDQYKQKCESYDQDSSRKIKYEKDLLEWKIKAKAAMSQKKDEPRKPKNPDPRHDQHSPSVLYNAMIAPLIPYAMRGVLWYQGESNTSTADIYDVQMRNMIYNWRNDWGQGDFPFIYVQLANYKDPVTVPVKDEPWVTVQEKQLKALSVRNTAMVVAIDNADPDAPGNIHPKNKQAIGERLAIAAMGKVYKQDITFMGPVFSHMIIEGNKAHIYFTHIGNGLVSKQKKITGFAIAGEDKQFVLGDAEIVDDHVVVSSVDIEKPLYVRYGWSKNPPVNLYNKSGLPASPFRTDDL